MGIHLLACALQPLLAQSVKINAILPIGSSLTVEALNTTISVWTYTWPDESQVSKSSYWDYGSVVQIPFPDDKLPEPEIWGSTGIIFALSTGFNGSDVIISWNTIFPASSQVWYYVTPAVPVPGPTDQLTNTVNLPIVQKMVDPPMYSSYTPIQPTPATSHLVSISGLNDGDVLTFVPLSRYVQTDQCVTATEAPRKITVNLP